jgi:lipid II:glycine glycyltransferase (peptidoglycan interpeptide bridge formation enzyme)
MLDIAKPMPDLRAQLEGRWRTSLAGAEASVLSVQRVGTNVGQYRWLLENEMQQRIDKQLEGLPLPFFDHYVQSRKQPTKNILTLRADVGRDRVAAMLFLIHGEAATYQIGWTSEQGRDLNAHHLILWRAIEELQTRGIRVLDLGGVNTVRSAGVARFKMRTGGQVLTLAGTYI